MSGAFLAALTYVVLNQLWPNGVGLFAGVGIILIGRAAGGILGHRGPPVPPALGPRPGSGAPAGGAPTPVGAAAAMGGETRAAG